MHRRLTVIILAFAAVSFGLNTYICPAVADTYVDEANPDSNYGSEVLLKVYNHCMGTFCVPLIRFDLSAIDPAEELVSAELHIYLMTMDTISIHPHFEMFDENEYTWNDTEWTDWGYYPPYGTGYGFVDEGWNTIELTGSEWFAVESWIQSPSGNYGFWFYIDGMYEPDFGGKIRSREYSGYEPELIVTTTSAGVEETTWGCIKAKR